MTIPKLSKNEKKAVRRWLRYSPRDRAICCPFGVRCAGNISLPDRNACREICAPAFPRVAKVGCPCQVYTMNWVRRIAKRMVE